MIRRIVLFGLFCLLGLQAASAQDSKKVKRVLGFLKTTCAVGEYEVEIKPTKEEGLTIRQLKDSGISVTGELTFSQKELEALAVNLTELIAQQDEDVRKCMEPYIKSISDSVRGTETRQ